MVGIVIALMFGAVEAGLLYFAHSVVMAAANAGASAASAGGGNEGQGTQIADRDLASLGRLGTDPAVQLTTSGGEVTVQASARIPSIVPFLPAITVRATALMRQELTAVGGGG